MNWKRIKLGSASSQQPEVAATPDAADFALPQDPAVRRAAKAAEDIPPLYPEDLADFDEFDFGGAVFGRKSGPAAGGQSVPAGPLNARDLPRHQQSGLRFVDARPLPFRGQRIAPGPALPPSRTVETKNIEARALPLRSRGKPNRVTGRK